MNEHDDLTRRLAEMGRHEVDPDVAARHLAAMRGVAPSAGRSRRLRPVAAAAAAAMVLAGAGVAAAALGGGGERPTPVVAEAPELPDEAAVDEVPVGPPAEVPPVEVPPADVDEVEPDGVEPPEVEAPDGDERGPGRAIAEARRMLRDARREAGCIGPPEWAGTPAEPGVGRSEQAREHAAVRAACGGGDGPDEAEGERGGPPAGVPPVDPPRGVPAEVPAGPPADVPPAEVPADVPPVETGSDDAGDPTEAAVVGLSVAADRAPAGAISD